MLEVMAFVIMMGNIGSESTLVEVPRWFGNNVQFETIDACEEGVKVINDRLKDSNSRFIKFFCIPVIKVN